MTSSASYRWTVLTVVAAAALLLASPASAQRLPGMPGSQGGSASQNMAEFYAHVMNNVAESMEAWRSAWAEDDVDGLSELYAEDAVLVLPEAGPVWGRAAIREALSASLGGVGQAQAAIGDVKASGRLVYVGGSFQIEMQEGPRAGERMEGFHSTVLYRTGQDWFIRSQVFRPEPGSGSAADQGL